MAVDISELFYKQKGLCFWCKSPMVLGSGGDRQATREHLVPRSHGGKEFVKKAGRHQRNIVAACQKCNQARGNMSMHVFRSTYNP